jgi:hypothetical protein
MDESYYQYYVIDYFATGEGRSIWMQISRNNCPHYPDDYFQKRWEKFVDVKYYIQGTEKLTEEEFMKRYRVFMPGHIKNTIEEKSMSIWQSHYHFNRS